MSSRVFAALTDYLWKLTCKWACWSHPNKPKRWIAGRYFGKFSKFRNDRWVFGDKDTGAYLPKPSWTDIVRHTLVKSGASPDDPALAGYWAQRRQKVKPPLDSCTVRLLSRQDGRCMAFFGVRVVSEDGSYTSGRQAVIRTLALPLSFLLLGLGFVGILVGDRRRALHDVIAGTAVIYSWDARAARLRFLSRG